MKIYSHDYTLPSKAEAKIHEAYVKCQDPVVKQLIEEAQELLRKYLAQDNLAKDDDVSDGFIKQTDIFDESDSITDAERQSIQKGVDDVNCGRTLRMNEEESLTGFLVRTKKKGE